MSSDTETIDINARSTLLAIVYICALPSLVVSFSPLLLSGMVSTLNLSEQQAGFISSADMTGYTVGTIVAFLIITRVDWRRLGIITLLLMIFANLLCSQLESFLLLMATRFLSGIGGGALTALMLSVIAQMRDPDSVYGLWFVAMSIIGVIGMLMFPALLDNAGVGAAFMALAGLLIVALFFVKEIPRHALNCQSIGPVHTEISVYRTGLGVLAILLVYIGLMGVWVYLGQIGDASGLDPQQVANGLALSAMGGIAGGALAAWLGARQGRLFPISAGVVGMSLAMIWLMFEPVPYYAFIICCIILYALWSFIVPYLLGTLAELERSGRALSLGNAALGGGYMLGPFFSALLVGKGTYDGVLFMGIAMLLLGFATVILLGENKLLSSAED